MSSLALGYNNDKLGANVVKLFHWPFKRKRIKRAPNWFVISQARQSAKNRLYNLCVGCVYNRDGRCPLNQPMTVKDIPWLNEFTGSKCNTYKREY
jgi:hypothetical protein